ncbi:sugar kinase [Lacticaseibacillus absianus]|uniref:sugar kinase n=1 Tax=Lacticaseibacillus absianus TaxID=2729623 RepID=UPI0015C89E2A|nr:sugar kinase [Lacticaseibacillus absianus]
MTIAAFGEVMLRLTVPEHLMLEQTDQLQMSYTGTGVNILASLAHFGHATSLISALPDNRLGRTAAGALRRLGVSDRFVQFRGDHLGSFFVELGFGNRPETVTYQNRLASAFGTSSEHDYPFGASLADVNLLHICGISLSLTAGTREAAFNYAEQAAKRAIPVCFDFNYRVALNHNNSHDQMKGYYERILQRSSIVFGSRRDLTDLLGYPQDRDDESLFAQFVAQHHLTAFAGTRRLTHDGRDYIQGFLCDASGVYWSDQQEVMILDRIGGGDAYAAGILHGLLERWPVSRTLPFAVANAALAHAQIGDSPLATTDQVEAFIANHGVTGALVR